MVRLKAVLLCNYHTQKSERERRLAVVDGREDHCNAMKTMYVCWNEMLFPKWLMRDWLRKEALGSCLSHLPSSDWLKEKKEHALNYAQVASHSHSCLYH